MLYAERVLRAGGRGYIMKQEGGKKLLQAIRQVLNGQIYVSEKMSARILETFSGRHAETAISPVQQLSDREFEVFQLIGQGKGTRDIAAHLHLSAKTVEVHRAEHQEKIKIEDGDRSRPTRRPLAGYRGLRFLNAYSPTPAYSSFRCKSAPMNT
jgi:DNA-binding NarL/FixJ family response regulator